MRPAQQQAPMMMALEAIAHLTSTATGRKLRTHLRMQVLRETAAPTQGNHASKDDEGLRQLTLCASCSACAACFRTTTKRLLRADT